MKILDFPIVRQVYNYDCGAAATQAVLRYFGIDIREGEVIKLAKTTKTGTPVAEIEKVLTAKKLKFKKFEPMTVAQLKKEIDAKHPVIILLQAWPKRKINDWEKEWREGHYVVAIGYDKNKIYFSDPAAVNFTFLTVADFKKRWHDIDGRNGRKYINFGLSVYGSKPKYKSKLVVKMN